MLATCVFCDLSGSTALAERVDAEAVYGMMRSYFEEARQAFEGHGGKVEKFIGDAVVAVFSGHEDDAVRACRAAVEIQERIGRLNLQLESRFGTGIAVRIGVSSGEVMEPMALGDAVNVAAQLERAAEPGEVLIGETTRRLAADAVTVEPAVAPPGAFRLLAVTALGAAT